MTSRLRVLLIAAAIAIAACERGHGLSAADVRAADGSDPDPVFAGESLDAAGLPADAGGADERVSLDSIGPDRTEGRDPEWSDRREVEEDPTGPPEDIGGCDPAADSDADGLSDCREAEIGTDPYHPDTDRDGVMDGEEVAGGTDPLDPASARAWHPEWTARPRLFFGPEDIAELRARTATPEGPWRVLWERIKVQSAEVPPEYPAVGSYDIAVAARWGAIAEASAMVGLMEGDPDAVARALALMSRDFPDPSGLSSLSNYDLLEAEALVAFCSAWDLLSANPLADPRALAAARAGLSRRLDTFRWMCYEGPVSFLLMLSRNNHPMKVFGALGLCALALNDRPDAARDLSEAMTGLDFLLNQFQSTPDGGYAEGWHYLQYGSESYLPFLAAYHRWANGESFPYRGMRTLQLENPNAGQTVWIQDFARNPRTLAVYRTARWSVRPDGLAPETDDANPSPMHGGILAWLFQEPEFLRVWFQPAVAWYSGRIPVATFALYDGGAPPAHDPPEPLEGALYDAGFAVFRDGWGPEAVYLVLQGEHGTVRVNGAEHEHADELSLLLRAYGQSLILDPGYINWEHHDLVRLASDHNTILVDGSGAPTPPISIGLVGVDAALTPMRENGLLTWVAVRTAYQGVEFQRRVVRIGSRFFVVEDRIEGAAGPRTFSQLWNGYGGGDVPESSFELREDGARWTGPAAFVEVHSAPVVGGPARLSHDLQEHATTWGQWAMHERLIVEQTMGSPAGFLTVISLGPSQGPFSAIEMLEPEDGVAAGRWSDADQAFLAVMNSTSEEREFLEWFVPVLAAPGLTIVVGKLDGEAYSGTVESHFLPVLEPD